MTEHDLKEMKNLGAELGAAKAENEKLRGLLRESRPIVCGYCDFKLLERIDAALAAKGGE